VDVTALTPTKSLSPEQQHTAMFSWATATITGTEQEEVALMFLAARDGGAEEPAAWHMAACMVFLALFGRREEMRPRSSRTWRPSSTARAIWPISRSGGAVRSWRP